MYQCGHVVPAERQPTAPAVAASVDRRVVVSPAQAGTLLDEVGRLGQRGAHLEAFFATLYYAALRANQREARGVMIVLHVACSEQDTRIA